MSGPCAYAIFTLYCVVCRVRALDLSRLSATGACANAHRSFHVVNTRVNTAVTVTTVAPGFLTKGGIVTVPTFDITGNIAVSSNTATALDPGLGGKVVEIHAVHRQGLCGELRWSHCDGCISDFLRYSVTPRAKMGETRTFTTVSMSVARYSILRPATEGVYTLSFGPQQRACKGAKSLSLDVKRAY
jgi:hypothetical protein